MADESWGCRIRKAASSSGRVLLPYDLIVPDTVSEWRPCGLCISRASSRSCPIEQTCSRCYPDTLRRRKSVRLKDAWTYDLSYAKDSVWAPRDANRLIACLV